ncbi:expressed unknown protein [Seminavis robusta]|uniref:Uncharacterized protein n=1 Tax=Seminavis robusta TaxID=568900 RepID=A0A9N8E8U1_9STRA|nr:expressed unknown protein [Seminavis robusta]|eukprot:Sro752_g197120.1 n/a (808) ;mRNA; r:4237-6660
MLDGTEHSKQSLRSIISEGHEGSGPRSRRPQRPFSSKWQLLMEVVALLDFMSTFANRRFFSQQKEALASGNPEGRFRFLTQSFLLGRLFTKQKGTPIAASPHFRVFGTNFALPHHVFTNLFLWLDAHSVHFGFLFSVLWCIEAFFEADRWADRRLSEVERRKVMARVRSMLRRKSLRPQLSSSEESLENFRTLLLFYGTLIVQFLLLPLGFYLLIYKYIVVKATSIYAAADDNDGPGEIAALLESTYESVNLPGEYRTFSNETKLALGFAIAKHSGKAVYKVTESKMKAVMWRQGLLEGRRLGWNAIRHPLRSLRNTFWSLRHGREFMRWVRWVKSLAPLVRRFAKLRSSLRALFVTYRQRHHRKIARIKRKRTWRRLNEQQRRSKACKIIQSTYRSYKQRQACMQIVLSRQVVNDLAARKIQLALRLMMENAKAKQAESKFELERLESRESLSLRNATIPSMMHRSERERLNELREQQASEKPTSIDKRLLMRPDSKFQLFWKILFIICVVIELVCLGLNFRLKRGDQTLKAKLQEMLIPVPVTQLKECSCLAQCRRDFATWETQVANKRKCRGEPWYCNPMYYNAQIAYTGSIRFVLEQVLWLLALVNLLDVPVSFYTGIYCSDTGILVPKPFLGRWVFLFIQLLTNPRMGKISNRVFRLLQSSFEIGPIRVLRWGKCLFYPSLLFTFDWTESHVWLPLVAFANGPATRLSMPLGERVEKASQRQRRRSSVDPTLPPSIFDPELSKILPEPTTRRLRRGSSLSSRMSIRVSVQQSTELLIRKSLNDSMVFSFLDEEEFKMQNRIS